MASTDALSIKNFIREERNFLSGYSRISRNLYSHRKNSAASFYDADTSVCNPLMAATRVLYWSSSIRIFVASPISLGIFKSYTSLDSTSLRIFTFLSDNADTSAAQSGISSASLLEELLHLITGQVIYLFLIQMLDDPSKSSNKPVPKSAIYVYLLRKPLHHFGTGESGTIKLRNILHCLAAPNPR